MNGVRFLFCSGAEQDDIIVREALLIEAVELVPQPMNSRTCANAWAGVLARRCAVAAMVCVAILASMGAWTGGAVQAAEDGVPAVEAPPSGAADQPPAPGEPSSLQRALLSNPFQTRSPESLLALLRKGEATGAELLEEIRAIKQAVAKRDLANATSQLLGTAEQIRLNPMQAVRGGSGFWGDVWERMLGKGMEAGASYLLTQISYAALEEFFERFANDQDVLNKVKVRLPRRENLSSVQLQQMVTLAGFVAAIQGAQLIAQAAQKDFEQVETGYKELMTQRLEAAKLFAEAMSVARGRERELQEFAAVAPPFDAADVAYLRAFPSNRLLKDFANDFRAQNLALRYLRAKKPEAFAQYSVRADRYIGAFKAYARAVAGAGSAGAFSFLFAQEARVVWTSQGLDSIAILGPLGKDWANGTVSLYKELTPSLVESFFARTRGFRISEAGVVIEQDTTAKHVMDRIAKAGAIDDLRARLFGHGADSYLYRVHLCDANFAARYIDDAHDVDQKKQFVKGYFGIEQAPADFNFKDALSGVLFPRQSEVLRSDLLARPLTAEDKAARDTAIREARAVTMLKTDGWDAHKLMRVLLANHAGTIADPYLAFGKLEIHLVPTKEALYEYESHLQGCTRHAMGTASAREEVQHYTGS